VVVLRTSLITLATHNGLKRSKICKEIFESLAKAKLKKYLCEDCFFLFHPFGALQALPYAALFTFELALASPSSKCLA